MGDEYFFGSGPPQGGGCVPSQGYERFEKKHTVVETNWLLLLNVIVSSRIIIVGGTDALALVSPRRFATFCLKVLSLSAKRASRQMGCLVVRGPICMFFLRFSFNFVKNIAKPPMFFNFLGPDWREIIVKHKVFLISSRKHSKTPYVF